MGLPKIAAQFAAAPPCYSKMSSATANRLHGLYCFNSPDFTVRAPEALESINTVLEGELAFSADHFKCGMRLPLCVEWEEILNHFGVVPAQVQPNGASVATSLIVYMREEKIPWSLHVFLDLVMVKGLSSGHLAFSSKRGTGFVLDGLPSKVGAWRKNFCFIKSEKWGIPLVPTPFKMSGLPALTDAEKRNRDRLAGVELRYPDYLEYHRVFRALMSGVAGLIVPADDIVQAGGTSRPGGPSKAGHKKKSKRPGGKSPSRISAEDAAQAAASSMKRAREAPVVVTSSGSSPSSSNRSTSNSDSSDGDPEEPEGSGSRRSNYNANPFRPSPGILALGAAGYDRHLQAYLNGLSDAGVGASGITGTLSASQAFLCLTRRCRDWEIRYDHQRETSMKLSADRDGLTKERDTGIKQIEDLSAELAVSRGEVAKLREQVADLTRTTEGEAARTEKAVAEALTSCYSSELFRQSVVGLSDRAINRALQALKDRGSLEPEFHDFVKFHEFLGVQARARAPPPADTVMPEAETAPDG